jgi:hypothetical protein
LDLVKRKRIEVLVAISRFWRFKESSITFFEGVPSDIQKVDPKLFMRVSPGHAILVGDLNPKTECGEVNWAGVIDYISESEASVKVVWRNADFILKPTAAGRVYWRKLDWFNFAKAVVERYMLDAIFVDLFDDIEWKKTRTRVRLAPVEPRTYESTSTDLSLATSFNGINELPGLPLVKRSMNPTTGFVYLIWSQYGYKIGKAVNVKSRTKLFEVKLPFPIRIEHYAKFSDYTQAERSLHLHFQDKRLEGEWFSLTDDDVAFIKTLGEPQLVE